MNSLEEPQPYPAPMPAIDPLHESAAVILIICTILVCCVFVGLLLGLSMGGWA